MAREFDVGDAVFFNAAKMVAWRRNSKSFVVAFEHEHIVKRDELP